MIKLPRIIEIQRKWTMTAISKAMNQRRGMYIYYKHVKCIQYTKTNHLFMTEQLLFIWGCWIPIISQKYEKNLLKTIIVWTEEKTFVASVNWTKRNVNVDKTYASKRFFLFIRNVFSIDFFSITTVD